MKDQIEILGMSVWWAIIGIIVVAVIAAIVGIGTWVNVKFQAVNTELQKHW